MPNFRVLDALPMFDEFKKGSRLFRAVQDLKPGKVIEIKYGSSSLARSGRQSIFNRDRPPHLKPLQGYSYRTAIRKVKHGDWRLYIWYKGTMQSDNPESQNPESQNPESGNPQAAESADPKPQIAESEIRLWPDDSPNEWLKNGEVLPEHDKDS